MSVLENSERQIIERRPKRNFSGFRLIAHRFKYTINPGDWENMSRTAYIIGEDFKAAEKELIKHMPSNKRFKIDEQGDSVLEIHALTPEIKQKLYYALRPEFDNKKKKLSDRIRGK